MLKVEHGETYGWESAIRGMRNPMNSWDKSDSGTRCERCTYRKCQYCDEDDTDEYKIGPNDLDLMKRLRHGGPDDRKYLRQIFVSCDITAPLYWWKELDQYKVGTVTNSCSTMHKIQSKEFTLDDFSCEHLTKFESGQKLNGWTLEDNDLIAIDDPDHGYSSIGILKIVIKALNFNRNKYLETKDKKYWWQMIQLLPSSYNQKRTWTANYEVLTNIYHARKNHKLDCWHTFCDWIESLPYSELIIGE